MAMHYQFFHIHYSQRVNLYYYKTGLMHTPLGIINIKYLLSTKFLLQSLNLVHLQFLEQRTDLGRKRVGGRWEGDKKVEIQKNICRNI